MTARPLAIAGLSLAMVAFLPAWLPFLFAFVLDVFEGGNMLTAGYGGGCCAIALNLMALPLAIASLVKKDEEGNARALGWGGLVMALIGTLGSIAAFVFWLFAEAFVNGLKMH